MTVNFVNMKNKIPKIILVSAILFSFFLISCKSDEPAPDNNTNQPGNKDTVVKLEDTLCRNWEVKTATHNGSADPSSVGLKLTMNRNGTYLLHTTGYAGTWEFTENKTKVLLDKAVSQYKTTWTIVKLTSKNLNVKFKSPFTGGAAEWNMTPY
jgi:hypothetical protein